MFLQSQSKNKIIAYLAAVSISIHVLLSWLLTVQFKFGLNGAMASTLLAYWIPNIGQLLFIMTKCPDINYGSFYSLEIWYNTVLILLTGNMKNAEVSINALAIW
ncbi:hypothetical protein JHK86_016612 [Glycine max]|nr:hypothetical protein JHK86_016612 [Glycine max]